jgi:ABC-type glycerol-3-phosphate transport system permease component
MMRLPQQSAPFVYGVIQASITTAVATAIATYQLTGLGVRFVLEWATAWALAFAAMLPVVIFVAPLIQRCVLALTARTTGDELH